MKKEESEPDFEKEREEIETNLQKEIDRINESLAAELAIIEQQYRINVKKNEREQAEGVRKYYLKQYNVQRAAKENLANQESIRKIVEAHRDAALARHKLGERIRIEQKVKKFGELNASDVWVASEKEIREMETEFDEKFKKWKGKNS